MLAGVTSYLLIFCSHHFLWTVLPFRTVRSIVITEFLPFDINQRYTHLTTCFYDPLKEKLSNPYILVEDINGNFQRKSRKKGEFSGGKMAIFWKSRKVDLKKIDILIIGGAWYKFELIRSKAISLIH